MTSCWIRGLLPALLAPVIAFSIAACGSQSSGSEASTIPGSEINVAAAASLTDAFATIADEFEKANPQTKVRASFGASSTIVDQVVNGAPVDALATASESTMAAAAKANVIEGTPQIFASNILAIAVPAGNPANIMSINDLTRPGVKLAVCQPQVPCGQTATELFKRANVNLTPVTMEPDVRAVLSKVTNNEVDAGIVYRSDVVAAGSEVTEIPIPETVNVTTRYPIAPVASRDNQPTTVRFIEYLLSPAGQQVLADNGFTPVTPTAP